MKKRASNPNIRSPKNRGFFKALNTVQNKSVLSQPDRFKKPPKKKHGEATVPRRIAGEILDVAAVAEWLGVSQGTIRARVARQQIPYRKWGGRIIFRRSEVEEYFKQLEGVSIDEALANERARREKVA